MSKSTIRIPQARVLQALKPKGDRKPVLTRQVLAERAGFTPTSGTINRALLGIAKGSSSGDPYPGLVDAGHVKKVAVPLDGDVTEWAYTITAKGIAALKAFAKAKKVGKVRSAKSSTNKRYA